MAFCDAVSRGMNSLIEAGGLLQKNPLPPVLFGPGGAGQR
jgi:lipopolysaccharide transport system permease protein